MKRNFMPKAALPYFIIGLLITSFTPIINRYVGIPDLAKGFLTGLGLALQVIALVKIDKMKRKRNWVKR